MQEEPDLAFESLFAALKTARPLSAMLTQQIGVSRAYLGGFFFSQAARELRSDPRFAKLCMGLGLHDYWRSSGIWPDCAEEVAPHYNFKAECEQAAAEIAKA